MARRSGFATEEEPEAIAHCPPWQLQTTNMNNTTAANSLTPAHNTEGFPQSGVGPVNSSAAFSIYANQCAPCTLFPNDFGPPSSAPNSSNPTLQRPLFQLRSALRRLAANLRSLRCPSGYNAQRILYWIPGVVMLVLILWLIYTILAALCKVSYSEHTEYSKYSKYYEHSETSGTLHPSLSSAHHSGNDANVQQRLLLRLANALNETCFSSREMYGETTASHTGGLAVGARFKADDSSSDGIGSDMHVLWHPIVTSHSDWAQIRIDGTPLCNGGNGILKLARKIKVEYKQLHSTKLTKIHLQDDIAYCLQHVLLCEKQWQPPDSKEANREGDTTKATSDKHSEQIECIPTN